MTLPNITYTKDPASVADYAIDWSSYLGSDTIQTATWAATDGITLNSTSKTTTSATAWVSGGTSGATYYLTNTITTAAGRTEDQIIALVVGPSKEYSSIGEVVAFTRHLLIGETTFNSTTRPPASDVRRMLARASAALNVALAAAGFTIPLSEENSRDLCADWVTQRTAEYVELTQRGVGYSDGEGSRATYFRNLSKSATEFVKENALGFKRLGAAVTSSLSSGLAFTGLTAQADRADPDDETLEQPLFQRRQFDDDSEADE